MNHILRNLLDGHHLGLNSRAVTSLVKARYGNHLLSTLILTPGCNSAIDEVTINEVVIIHITVNQAVVAINVLNIQVDAILIDGGQCGGELTLNALAQAIELGDVGNGNRLVISTAELDGQNLINGIGLTIGSHNAIDVIGLGPVAGQSSIEGAIVVSTAVAVGIGESTVIVNINLLEQHVLRPDVVTHLIGGNLVGGDSYVAACRLETAERGCQLGLGIVGGLGTTEASGDHVTHVVSLIEVAISQTETGLVHGIQVTARLIDYDRLIVEGNRGAVGLLGHLAPTEALTGFVVLLDAGGKQLINDVLGAVGTDNANHVISSIQVIRSTHAHRAEIDRAGVTIDIG